MAIPFYLAMTSAEFSRCGSLPQHLAWMSCRFSLSGKGLSNLPPALPAGSLLILDDQTPPDGQDISLIRQQLADTVEANQCCALLLDFQRPNDPQTAQIAAGLLSLPCPVCVSHLYAKDLSCPVLLPPCPFTTPLASHIAPWEGRKIWLEASIGSLGFSVTEAGCKTQPCDPNMDFPFHDRQLHCHYRIDAAPHRVLFSLIRRPDDLAALLEDGASLGITQAVGLWQELRQ